MEYVIANSGKLGFDGSNTIVVVCELFICSAKELELVAFDSLTQELPIDGLLHGRAQLFSHDTSSFQETPNVFGPLLESLKKVFLPHLHLLSFPLPFLSYLSVSRQKHLMECGTI